MSFYVELDSYLQINTDGFKAVNKKEHNLFLSLSEKRMLL